MFRHEVLMPDTQLTH